MDGIFSPTPLLSILLANIFLPLELIHSKKIFKKPEDFSRNLA